MKKYLKLLMMVISASVIACEKPDLADPNGNSQGEGETEKVGSMTITLEKVTATTAYFKAYTKKTAPDLELGIYYSEYANDHIYECERVWDYDFEVGEICELVIKDLDANTTYYYRPYIITNGVRELGDELSFITSAESLTIDKVTVDGLTATFIGNVDLCGEGGVYCSTNRPNTNAGTASYHRLGYGEPYTLTLNNLSSNTVYYYCTYRFDYENGTYVYGPVKNFTTGNVTLTIDNVNIMVDEVVFTGDARLDCEGGIVYSTKSSITKNDCLGIIDLSNKIENFSESIRLPIEKTYYYCTYYWNNSTKTYVYSEVQSFKTANFQWNIATDLSKNESANCYIVSESGLYKIKGVKGNSVVSVGTVSHTEVLWESFGTGDVPKVGLLVETVTYKDDYVGFIVPDTFKEGNAVIAVKDVHGAILWSWHIWLTDQPQKHVYKNDAGTMMDRNLGATSATKGDVGALGLLYQWGRKDPFLSSSRIKSSFFAKSTITWPSTVKSESSTGTIEYATAHPTTFITYNSKNGDWYYTGDSSTDNTRWTTSSREKSIYDPCPAGWRVPDGGSNGVWAKAIGSTMFSFNYAYDSVNSGIDFLGKFSSTATIWYPASGYRYYSDGGLNFVGYGGDCWSASPNSKEAFALSFSDDGYVYPSYSKYRAYGYSVRCLQESK